MARAPDSGAPRKGARPPILALRDIALQDGARMLFDGVDLALETRTRACLVGRNGAGKSTLLRLLAGEILPDRGERFVQPGMRFANVPQEPRITGPRLIDHAAAGGAAEHEAAAALEEFGLDPGRAAEGLSGGEVRRCALARAFAEEPDVLLLDEPTNHLDILAIETLERKVRESRSALLVVSHDRRFLEGVTDRCFWLAHRKVRTLEAGFSEFDTFQQRAEAEEQERLRRLQKAIERETYTFYRSITAQRTRNEGRARALEAMRQERALILKDQSRPLELGIEDAGRSGRLVVEAKGLSKAYGDRVLVEGFSTRVLRGDRVALVGPNGAGKTTLVRLLLGEIAPDAGEVRLGSQLSVVYLDQARAELSGEETLMEVLAPSGGDSLIVRGRSMHVAAYAKDFLFSEAQLRQPVASLSGGERNRLLLARGLAKPANLLVLDEPTNDLDMETLELLEDRLGEFEGTLLLVSHDRDFIDRLATSTIALNGRGRTVETPGGWTDFVAKNPDFLKPPEALRATRAKSPPPQAAAAPERRPVKLSFKDERRIKECEEEMEALPARIRALEARLGDPELFYKDPAAFQKVLTELEGLRLLLARAEEDWMALEERKSALLSAAKVP